MLRRDFLKGSLVVGSQVVAGYILATPDVLARAEEATGIPYQDLRGQLAAEDALIVTPSDAAYADYLTSFNLRTQLNPQVRIMCQTSKGVAMVVSWARARQVKFAVRCGGHSYEGFSQSREVVIDLRLMNKIEFDPDKRRARVGGGCNLEQIYQMVGAKGQAAIGGSCPTVGIGGHFTGGGYGHFAREYGLSCDSVLEMEIVNANGEIVRAAPDENDDLFWACRGGGGGTFGIITRFDLQTYKDNDYSVFGVTWDLPVPAAADVVREWQRWAPHTFVAITSFLRLNRSAHTGGISVHIAGQGGDIKQVTKEMQTLLNLHTRNFSLPFKIEQRDFLGAIRYYGPSTDYPSNFMKGKSDFVLSPMSDKGITTLLSGLQEHNGVGVVCDAYGGAIETMKSADTAFPFRAGTLYSMQYSTSWTDSEDTEDHIQRIRNVWNPMRPHVSGHAYVNYPDLDLGDLYQLAYWGDNLPRLQAVKRKYDPDNIFNHAQSVKG